MEISLQNISIGRFANILLDHEQTIILSKLEIYDYLEYKTKGFEATRVRLVIEEMEFFYESVYELDLQNRVLKEYKAKNKEIPYIELFIPDIEHFSKTGEFIQRSKRKTVSPDYAKMTLKHRFFETVQFHQVINLLKSKMEPESTNIYSSSIITENTTVKEIFNKAITSKLMTVKGDKYKWNKTKALLAYFISKISDELKLTPSNGRIPWKDFKPLFGYKNKDNSLTGALNDLQKSGTLPLGHEIVDSLFK